MELGSVGGPRGRRIEGVPEVLSEGWRQEASKVSWEAAQNDHIEHSERVEGANNCYLCHWKKKRNRKKVTGTAANQN